MNVRNFRRGTKLDSAIGSHIFPHEVMLFFSRFRVNSKKRAVHGSVPLIGIRADLSFRCATRVLATLS